MIKYFHMNKIADYFYIFSKLSTSLVLFLSILFMGYGLIKIYNNNESQEINLQNEISVLSNLIKQNANEFKKIENKIKSNENLIIETKSLINKSSKKSLKTDFEKEIKQLIDLNSSLKKEIFILKDEISHLKNYSSEGKLNMLIVL